MMVASNEILGPTLGAAIGRDERETSGWKRGSPTTSFRLRVTVGKNRTAFSKVAREAVSGPHDFETPVEAGQARLVAMRCMD
jgi:hypothetical protein